MQRTLTCLTVGLAAALLGLPASALLPCTVSCSRLEILDVTETSRNQPVTLSIDFTQADDDGRTDRGNDDIAALAFTVGVPGTGTAAPLHFDCTDRNGDGLPDAVRPGPAIASGFRVVIENALCTNRNRCLCPDSGQTRDNFINVAVYGPKDLPAEGPVVIPEIPSGRLVDIDLRIAADAPQQTVRAHVFNETDDPLAQPKPQFGAFFSQGDKSAVDETADRSADRSKVIFRDATIPIGPPQGCACLGDCNGNGVVSVDELIKGVNIALGSAALDTCACFDANGDLAVAINELIGGVNNALNGCPGQ